LLSIAHQFNPEGGRDGSTNRDRPPFNVAQGKSHAFFSPAITAIAAVMAVIASVFAVMLLGRGIVHLINLSIMIVSS
jgi:hypothetical protein